MAGIGFVLRKLASQDDFMGIVRAYFNSIIASVGPWILAVVFISSLFYLTNSVHGPTQNNEFLAIVLYNFFFSFVISSPLYMVACRYVADCLYRKELSPIPGIFIQSIFYLFIPGLPLALLFYTFYAKMTPAAILMSCVNFLLLAEIWIVMLYLDCIRNFRAITLSWSSSILIALLSSIYLGNRYGSTGLLTGFNIGLLLLVFSIKAQILAEYPFGFKEPKEFRYYFRHNKGLFKSGFLLFAGMWIDKIIMWTSPEAVTHLNNLRTFPLYDGAMFFSYLSIIPVMALFFFSLETNFYESYLRYIQHIERNAPLMLIDEEKGNIITKIKENGRSILILQGSISLIVIAFAPNILEWIQADFLQVSIFQLGTLGAFFSALNLFIVILFSYFDSHDNMVKITSTLLISNGVFTLISQHMGFAYYGAGYCLAMILTFFVAATLLVRFLSQLNYHIFITNIVKRTTIRERI